MIQVACAIHIHFVCISLNVGGGEIMLVRICRELAKRGHRLSIAVLIKPSVDSISSELKKLNVELIYLNVNRPFSFLPKMFSWWRWLRQAKPQVVQGWMYHGNLMTLVPWLALSKMPVFWSLHSYKIDSLKICTKIVVRICGYLSRFVPKIIFSASQAAIPAHVAYGYSSDRMQYLPNGFKYIEFEEIDRDKIRSDWNIPLDVPLIGWVGRNHSDKDLVTFLRAAFLAASYDLQMHFVAIGYGVNQDIPEFVELANSYPKVASRIHLLGAQQNAGQLMIALDLLVMSSKTEAFPLVLIEALASGVSAVATDVGDCSMILENLGLTVASENYPSLAFAILAQYHRASTDFDLPRLCKERVAERYTMDIMIESLLRAYTTKSSFEQGS